MYKNFQYATAEMVHQSLARRIKNKNFSVSDVATWCSECLREEIRDFMHRDLIVRNYPLKVHRKRAKLPGNISVLKAVKSDNEFVRYKVSGTYLFFADDLEEVRISYAGLPIDSDTGYVLVPRGAFKACRAYCEKNIFYEDYMTGRIDGQRYGLILQELDRATIEGRNEIGDIDMAESAELIKIMHNMVFEVGHMPEDLL